MNENKIELRKHRSIIQMQNIDAVARKAYNALLYNAYEARFNDNDCYTINLAKLKELAGIGDTSNKNIKRHIVDLMKHIVEMDILNGDEEWRAMALIQDVRIKNGELEYCLPKLVKKALFEPDKYATIDLTIIKGLRSKYAIALYELAMDYKKKEIPKMTIEDFRKIMGIEPGKYTKSFTDLERFVIKKAVDEINASYAIDFSLRYKKFYKGRKVTHIKFFIDQKEKDDEESSFREFIDRLRDCYRGKSIYTGKYNDEFVDIAINREGLLYNAKTLKKFSKSEAWNVYRFLYELYKKDKQAKEAINNCKTFNEEDKDITKQITGKTILYNEIPCIVKNAYRVGEASICLELLDEDERNYTTVVNEKVLSNIINGQKKSAEVEHKK